MKIRAYIHECLEKLQQLGICATEEEEKYAEMILGMPEEILENMEPGQITGMLLGAAGQLSQGGEGTTGVYAFDTELPDPSQMGTEFLQGISRISGGELEITDIEEAYSMDVLEEGTGTWPVNFVCNGTAYHYDVNVYHDWFDTGLLDFMGQVVKEQNTGSRLYVTGDGYQECIIFYQTEIWARNFEKEFHTKLERL